MGLNLFENHFPIDGYFKVFFKQHTSYFKNKYRGELSFN